MSVKTDRRHAAGGRAGLVVLTALAVAALVAGTAGAKVRAGSVSDPRESSLPAGRDMERVSASYDDRTGKFLVIVRLYGPSVAASDATELVILSIDFGPQGGGACASSRPNGVTFLTDIDPNRTSVAASSPRLKTPVLGKKSVSGDRREIQISLARPDLAGMDLRCAQVTVRLAGATAYDQLDTPVFFPGPFTTPPVCVVPKVVGRPLGQAKRAMTGANCALGTVKRARSKRMRAGFIISQQPRPGTKLSIGSRVAVVVSRGVR